MKFISCGQYSHCLLHADSIQDEFVTLRPLSTAWPSWQSRMPEICKTDVMVAFWMGYGWMCSSSFTQKKLVKPNGQFTDNQSLDPFVLKLQTRLSNGKNMEQNLLSLPLPWKSCRAGWYYSGRAGCAASDVCAMIGRIIPKSELMTLFLQSSNL